MNKEVVVLLALLNALIALMMPAPFREMLISGGGGETPTPSAGEVMAALPAILFASAVLFIVNAVITAVIVRLIVLGRSEVMAGGVAALVRRSARILLRSLGALGWFLLAFLPVLLISAMLSAAFSGGGQPVMVLLMILWALFVLSCAVAAFYAAALAEGIDRPFGVADGWRALKGKRSDLVGAILILTIVAYLILALVDPLVGALGRAIAGESAAQVASFLLSSVVGGILTYVLIAGTYHLLAVTAPGLLGPRSPPDHPPGA